MRLKFISFILAVFSNFAHAELVASYQQALNKQDGYIVQLSGLQRGTAQKEKSICEEKGMRMAFISVTNVMIFPRTISYAGGCWYYSNNSIVVSAKTLRENLDLNLSLPAKEFKTTPDFSSWKDYARYTTPIKKPLTKEEQAEAEIIATSYKVMMKSVFPAGLAARLTNRQTAECDSVGGKVARLSGCGVANSGRCITAEACWIHDDGEIKISGNLNFNGNDFPLDADWKASDFSKSENFTSWDSGKK